MTSPSSLPAADPDRRRWLRAGAAVALGTLLPGLAAAQSAPGTETDTWPADALAALIDRIARRNAVPPDLARSLIGQAQYSATVAQLILPGPPQRKNWTVYRSRFLDPLRIGAGSDFVQEFGVWLDRARRRFGVPPQVIAGILGVETIYGRNMGGFRVIDSLSTLALRYPAQAPRDRSAYFGEQLGDFLQWCARDRRDPLAVRGSYAGAIGMPQFMPGNILRYAVDFDDGGAVDLIGDPADAVGSVANFLAAKGWIPHQPTHFPLQVPSDLPPATLDALLAPDITPTFSAADLRAAGLPLLPRVQAYPGRLAVVRLPNADAAPDYVLGTDNFYVITRYNHSAFYALAVIELGEAVTAAARG